MEESISEVVVGVLVAVMGLVGLLAASGALDNEMYVFGLGLAVFAVLFLFGLVKRHFDESERGDADV